MRGRRRADGLQVGACAVAEVDRIDFLARVDRLVLGTIDLEDRQRTLVEGTEDRVVDHHVAARDLGVELDDRGTPGRDQRGLHVFLRVGAAFLLHAIEDLADDMVARCPVIDRVGADRARPQPGLPSMRGVT